LKKGLYKTSHSGKFWDDDLKDWLTIYGFEYCPSDQSTLIRRSKGEYLYIINYVDDMLYFSSSRKFEEQF
jgi:hypothetical protein